MTAAHDTVHTAELLSPMESRITNVTVHANYAEVTRCFRVNVKCGRNNISISGLPKSLDRQSVVIECQGPVVVQNLCISRIPPPDGTLTSAALAELMRKEEHLEKAREACLKALDSLEACLNQRNIQECNTFHFGRIVETYNVTRGRLESKIMEVTRDLGNVNEQLDEEQSRLAGPCGNDKLRMKVEIGILAEHDAVVELMVTYTVCAATWAARYEITQIDDGKVALVYNAAITQNTGEAWDGVPVMLAVAGGSPVVPILKPWNVSLGESSKSSATTTVEYNKAPATYHVGEDDYETNGDDDEDDDESESEGIYFRDHRPSTPAAETCQISRALTIPPNGTTCAVEVVRLILDAAVSWIAVPKLNDRTYMVATITNNSHYTLVPGVATVYRDGTLVSRSEIPTVRPHGAFECSLGFDTGVWATYHPRVQQVIPGEPMIIYRFTQHITVTNSKSAALVRLKIMDQIPISENPNIRIKLLHPPLPDIEGGTEGLSPLSVQVSKGVTSQWVVTNGEMGTGHNGRLSWLCSLKSTEQVDLALRWEVSTPAGTRLMGL